MTKIESQIIRERFKDADGNCRCGVCGGVLKVHVAIIKLTPKPARIADFIPACADCSHIKNYQLEVFRQKMLTNKKRVCVPVKLSQLFKQTGNRFYFETLNDNK